MHRRVALLSLGVFLAAAHGWAQAPAPQPERRTFAVSVLDKDGHAVHGLTAANFRGTYRGQPVKILSATEDSSPRRIALLIDVSGSMTDKTQWTVAWAAAKDLVLSIGPQHEIVLYSLRDTLSRHGKLVWRDEKELGDLLGIAEASAGRSRGGGSALCDGIIEAAGQLAADSWGGAVYLVTDGVDTSSRSNLDDAKVALVKKGIRLYVLQPDYGAVTPFAVRMSLQLRTKQITKEATSATGGRMLTLRQGNPMPIDFPAQLRPLYESLTNVYRVELELPAPVRRAGEWKLEVVDSSQRLLEDLQVSYANFLVPLKVR